MQKRVGQVWVMLAMAGMYWLWLRNGWWGAGLTIINLVYLGLAWQRNKSKRNLIKFLYGSSALLGLMMAIRSYGVLRAVTVMTIVGTNILISAWQRKRKIKSNLLDVFATLIFSLMNTGKVLMKMSTKIIGQKKVRNEKKWVKILSGIAWSVPLVLVFLFFFSQADPIFNKLLTNIKWPKIDTRLVVDLCFAVLFGGMAVAMLGAKIKIAWETKNMIEKIGGLDLAVMILQGLFIIFSLVQIRYFLVSGEELKAMGINFSDYTRKGYGEMLFCCFLAMGVMWMTGEMINFGKRKSLVKLYAGEICLFVATATRRNYFYQANNGFTRVRLWGFALSILIVAMVTVLLIKIIREKREAFLAKATVVLLVCFVLGLNLANIDKLIAGKPAKINGEIDYIYLSGLSEDAWPIWEKMLVENETAVKNKNYDEKLAFLPNWFLEEKDKLERLAEKNWQNGGKWNLTRVEALKFLRENEGRIRENKGLTEELAKIKYGF